MRKFAAAVLFILTLAAPSFAEIVSLRGIVVDVPAGWKIDAGEELLIFNKEETSAVTVTSISKNFELSLKIAAFNLSQAVGVPQKNVRSSTAGEVHMSFVQNGEKVSVRLIEEKGSILMICAIGDDKLLPHVAQSVSFRAGAKKPPSKVPVLPYRDGQVKVE
ncbi:MAG: hypothetical protein SOZ52_07310 [Pyramidobacter sp.]|nr:hypothetical protein [Pyramidobacter sp.]